uniref:Uncharacterized protein n=1 Tax=Ixodes ricinus TaxID=34613 RepID=A0A6B0U349_IXORI
MWCIVWPNSWKKVVTSLWVKREGLSAVGFGKLHRTPTTASCLDPSAVRQPGCMGMLQKWLYFPSLGNRSMRK